MGEAYDDDLAAEQAIFEQIEGATARAGEVLPPINTGGRPHSADPIKVIAWRQAHKASIRATAERWRVSEASVKRWTRDYGAAAELERTRHEQGRLDGELRQHERGYAMMFLGQRNHYLNMVDGLQWFGRCERARGTDQEAAVMAAREAALADADQQFRDDWERCMGPIPEFATRS